MLDWRIIYLLVCTGMMSMIGLLLLEKLISHAKKFFQITFQPKDVVVIGDTVFDIRCGKAIGAQTIAVTTGGHLVTKVDPKAGTYKNALAQEHPDLLVDSLMDQKVLTFFT